MSLQRATDATPSKGHRGKPQMVYVQTIAMSDAALQNMTKSPVVGFDIEWRPTFVKGRPENRVACIQLADQTSVVVMQVFAMNGLPQVLVKILQDSSIMKVGVGIFGDAKKIKKDCNVRVENLLDLSILAREVDPFWDEEDRQRAEARKALALEQAKIGMLAASEPQNADIKYKYPTTTTPDDDNAEQLPERPKGSLISLARLTSHCLSLTLVKNKRISTSNWERVLTEPQIEYAANDAAVAYDIYQMLQSAQTRTSIES